MKSYSCMLSAVAATMLLTACATVQPPTQSGGPPTLPWPGTDGEYQVKFPEPKQGEDRFIHLAVGADIRRDCDFSPHFEFDSAEPLPQDRIALKMVADCLNLPGLQRYDVALIGRADARGSDQYNAMLGMERAHRVKNLLVQDGVDPGRLEVKSSGERGAKGAQPDYAHGYDRRVDVVLQGAAHAPAGPVGALARGNPSQG